MPEFQTYPPSTFDRADGLDGRPGTPTPAGKVMYINDTGGIVTEPYGSTFLEEEADSPEIERAEQATIVHKFKCDPQTGIAILTTMGRGALLEDSFGLQTRVLSSRMVYQRGGYVSINITAEGLNFDTPPDQFDIETVELNPGLEKHPRYTELTYKDRFNIRNANVADEITLAQTYANVLKKLPGAPPGGIGPVDPNVRNEYNEAQEMLFKLHKGEDSFYLASYKVTWSQFYWIPVPINPGGYVEDPILDQDGLGGGALPFFFWSTDGTENGDSIWSKTDVLNPIMFANGISWLRLSDTLHYERTWFKLTRSWLGGPLGHWDKELYTFQTQNGNNRVQQPYQTQEDQGALQGG